MGQGRAKVMGRCGLGVAKCALVGTPGNCLNFKGFCVRQTAWLRHMNMPAAYVREGRAAMKSIGRAGCGSWDPGLRRLADMAPDKVEVGVVVQWLAQALGLPYDLAQAFHDDVYCLVLVVGGQ